MQLGQSPSGFTHLPPRATHYMTSASNGISCRDFTMSSRLVPSVSLSTTDQKQGDKGGQSHDGLEDNAPFFFCLSSSTHSTD